MIFLVPALDFFIPAEFCNRRKGGFFLDFLSRIEIIWQQSKKQWLQQKIIRFKCFLLPPARWDFFWLFKFAFFHPSQIYGQLFKRNNYDSRS